MKQSNAHLYRQACYWRKLVTNPAGRGFYRFGQGHKKEILSRLALFPDRPQDTEHTESEPKPVGRIQIIMRSHFQPDDPTIKRLRASLHIFAFCA